jgi:hypothetical protein
LFQSSGRITIPGGPEAAGELDLPGEAAPGEGVEQAGAVAPRGGREVAVRGEEEARVPGGRAGGGRYEDE